LCQAPMFFICRATAPVAGVAGEAPALEKAALLTRYPQRTFPFEQGRV
jgi:hypothetical protein